MTKDQINLRARENYKEYYQNNSSEIIPKKMKYAKEHKEQYNAYLRKHRRKLFTGVLNHYGNKCSIPECGSNEKLCIDHIGGWNGESPKGNTVLWRWLKKNNFPPGFRTLCQRCNKIDGFLRKHKALGINGIDALMKLKRG